MEDTRFVLCGPRRQTGDIPSVKLDGDNFSDNARGDTRQLNILTLSVYSTAAIDLDKKLQGSVRRQRLSPIERGSQRLKVP